jgi:hypothetical protein
MPLTTYPTRHVGAVVPIHKDRAPHRREVEVALAVVARRLGPECRKELDVLYRAFSHHRKGVPND